MGRQTTANPPPPHLEHPHFWFVGSHLGGKTTHTHTQKQNGRRANGQMSARDQNVHNRTVSFFFPIIFGNHFAMSQDTKWNFIPHKSRNSWSLKKTWRHYSPPPPPLILHEGNTLGLIFFFFKLLGYRQVYFINCGWFIDRRSTSRFAVRSKLFSRMVKITLGQNTTQGRTKRGNHFAGNEK